MTARRPAGPTRGPVRFASLAATALLFAACSGGNNSAPAIGVAQDPVVGATEKLPGVVVTIESVRGSGANGTARVGDRLIVDFTVATDSGAPLELSGLTRGAIMVSGPTSNYQRVIPSQSDLIARSTKRALGAYRYQFNVPVPEVYAAPLNDTPTFTDGELTGQALVSGTYTVGIELRKDYTIDDVVYRDPGNAAFDFLFGDATQIEKREVVTLANCNTCHGELRAHGDNRNNLTNCLLCHTAGSEDRNVATVAGGTPDVTVDFKVMIHKIHNGAHLPSVNGVTTNPDGSRNYGAPRKPYEIIGFGDRLIDFSEVGFPVWPSLATGMPRDIGYNANPTAQSQENAILGGAVACGRCHGDPDGGGPLAAPAQGDRAYSQPTFTACSSCHDDWKREYKYTSNNQTMPEDRDDSSCRECHEVSGNALAVQNAHRHPLTDPDFVRGLAFEVSSVTDVGGNNNGKFDPGEKVRIAMTIKDRNGADVPATSLARMEAVLNGPTTNPNMLQLIRIYPAGLPAGPDYEFNLPQNYYYEPVGFSDPMVNNQVFGTTHAPHWAVTGAATSAVLVSNADVATTLAAEAKAYVNNYIDVAPGAGASFAKDNYILIEPTVAARREYMRIQRVEGDRLWFSSIYSPNYAPNVRKMHPAGSLVVRVITSPIASSKYSLNPATGVITEMQEFGFGEVIVSYTSDFIVPDVYPGTINDSPDLDQTWGDWVGLPLLSGTYTLGIYGEVGLSFNVAVGGQSQSTSYVEVSAPTNTKLLFGSATQVEDVARIDNADGCYRCHDDLQFHGNHRRGVDSCLLCHGVAGAEDAATYVYPSGVATPGVTIDFRTMLHKIHRGSSLANASTYVVGGFGGNGVPFGEIGYPFMPGGVQNCASCHGPNSTAWVEPADRNHPNGMLFTRSWRAACGACHDTTADQAHIDVNSAPNGGEACAICHGVGEDKDVRTVHTVK